MTGISFAGILSILRRIANTSPASCCSWVAVAVALCVGHRIGLGQDIGGNSSDSTPAAANQQQVGKGSAGNDAENQQTKVSAADAEPRESLIDVLYEFGPDMGQIRKLPNGWKRQRGVDYKTYVKIGMVRDNRGASDLETLTPDTLALNSGWLEC